MLIKNDMIELNKKYEMWRWDIDKVTNNRKSYEIQQGNHDVKVAIIDSGIDENHPDLKSNLIDSKNFVPYNSSTEDTLGHGTMVAGQIAANGNIKGVAPKVAIVSYKVFDDNNRCESAWVINAIIEAANDNMDVINLSLGTYKSLLKKNDLDTLLSYKKAIDYAESKNCIVIAASGTRCKGANISNPSSLARSLGHENDLVTYLPAGLPNVIAVSATNKDNKIAFYSNYGTDIGISAPAADYGPDWKTKGIANLKCMTVVAYPLNLQQSKLSLLKKFEKGYEFLQGGTSIAAPKVSAAAALLIAEYNEQYGSKPSILEIKKLLYDGACLPDYEKNSLYFGNGILNVENSLKLISYNKMKSKFQ